MPGKGPTITVILLKTVMPLPSIIIILKCPTSGQVGQYGHDGQTCPCSGHRAPPYGASLDRVMARLGRPTDLQIWTKVKPLLVNRK